MKPRLLIALIAISLSACNMTQPHEKLAQEQASKQGLIAVKKGMFDASFVAPNANFEQYKKIRVDDLDLTQVKIRKPTVQRIFDEPWELTDKDKAYYQEKFAKAAKNNLIDSGIYEFASTNAADTLVLKGRVIEIAPLGPKDDMKGRPTLMDVYSEGFGRMTVAFDLYDSVTNKLVFSATDEHDLGKVWEKNDRLQNNMQVRLAFEHWLGNLKAELQDLVKHKS